MNRSWVPLLIVSLLWTGFVGCAGGWKNGPPGEPESTSGGTVSTTATGSGEVTFTWKGSAQSVHVAGDFNDWNPTADELTESGTDVWTLTKTLPAGEHQYKLVINGSDWKEDPNAAETADDGYGGKNSVVVVTPGAGSGAGAAVAAGAAAGAAAAAAATGEPAEVIFSWEGEADRVNLAGDFNNWSDSADPMHKNADGIWQITKTLPPGSHQYKFVINGTDWKEDPNAAEAADDGYGGKNSVAVVGAAAAGTAAAAGAVAAGAVAGAGPEITPEGVVFTYAGAAQSVNLAGDFNNWSTSEDSMTKNADGVWTIVKKLDAGTYSYKFFIDGSRWEQDKANPDSTDDGFGGKNSVVTVP